MGTLVSRKEYSLVSHNKDDMEHEQFKREHKCINSKISVKDLHFSWGFAAISTLPADKYIPLNADYLYPSVA